MSRVVLTRWTKRLSADEWERALARLSRPDQDRLRRLRHWQVAQASLIAAALMVELAAEELGAEPREIQLGRDSAGRPFVCSRAGRPARGIDVNASHSRGGYVAAAVSRAGRVGVDIEEEREVRPGVAERCLAASELAWMREGEPAQRRARFFRLWTLKEAYLKAAGTGMRVSLRSIAFQVDGEAISLSAPAAVARTRPWQFRSWRVDDAAWLALCAADQSPPPRFERRVSDHSSGGRAGRRMPSALSRSS